MAMTPFMTTQLAAHLVFAASFQLQPRWSLRLPERSCLAARYCLNATSVFAGMVVAFGRGRRRSHNSVRHASAVWQIFDNGRPKADRIDDEIAAMRLQEQKDLALLRAQLDAQGPSNEDLHLAALKLQNSENARRLQKRKQRAQAEREHQMRSPQLPGSWRAILHPSTNRLYYYNEETRTTSWTLPFARPSPMPMSARPPEPPLPWNLVPEFSSGRWYYHNTVTGQTSWEQPRLTPVGSLRLAKVVC